MIAAETDTSPRPKRRGLSAGLRTIRGSVLVAFLATALMTACVAFYGIASIRHAGELVRKTYDQSLMSINYARAAQADFEGMRAAFARNLRTRAPDEHAANQLIQLEQSLKEDLAVAAQRSQSLRGKSERRQGSRSRCSGSARPTHWHYRGLPSRSGTILIHSPRRSAKRLIS